MSCTGTSSQSRPFTRDIVVPRDADLYVKVQGKYDGEPFNFDAGDLVLRIYQNEGSTEPIQEFDNQYFTLSKSDSELSFNDVYELLVQRQEIEFMKKGREYPFTIVFTHNNNSRTRSNWQGNIIRRR